MLVAVLVAMAMAAITERAVLTGAVPGALRPPPSARPVRTVRPSAHGTPRPTRTTPSVLPPDLKVLDFQVRRVMMQQRGAAAQRIYGKQPDSAPVVTTTRVTASHRWGFGTTAIPAPTDRTALPQAALWLANWTGHAWQVALTGSAEFRAMLRRTPSSLIPQDERSDLGHLGLGTSPGLMLPWQVGDTWQMPAVADIAAFQGGDGRVLAAADGRIYHFCGSMIWVVHASGPATQYYALDRPTGLADGTRVHAGDYLGQIGGPANCGGGVDQPELLFGLTGSGGQVPLDGTQIGGWTFREKDGFGWAERGQLRVDADGALPNFGPPFVFPTAPPTSTPSPQIPPDAPQPRGSAPRIPLAPTPTPNGSDRRSTGALPQQ